MRVEAGAPALLLREQITNEGGEPIDYMWGHHPSYGPPFLSDACRIDIGARVLRADDSFDGPYNHGTALQLIKQVQNGQWKVVWPTQFAAPGVKLIGA